MSKSPLPSTSGISARLEREHAVYRRKVLTAFALITSGFPVVAIAMGGEILTLRAAVPLLLIEIPCVAAILLARVDRIGVGVAALTVAICVAAFDAHVVQQISTTAIVFPTVIVALGASLLPRRSAGSLAALMIGVIFAMRVGRLLTSSDSDPWFPATIDAITLAVAIATLGLVDRVRIERDRHLLQQTVADLEQKSADLERAKERAEENARVARQASATRSLFLSRASHELRTPLNAILGYTELLLEETDALDPQIREDLTRIESATHQQLNLVEDLLQLTRAQGDQIEVRRQEIEIEALVAPVSDQMASLAERHGTKLVVVVEPACVQVDVANVRRILLGLLSNAVKYAEGGTVRATVRIVAQPREIDAPFGLSIEVADDGVGIAADRLPVLFQPFAQGEACSADRRQGTGLGLPIVAALVDAMEGHHEVHSEVGVGSRFRVVIPA